MTSKPQSCIKNIAETPWQEFPNHHGGALSKALVHPETLGSRQLDYRISTYAPMAYVKPHAHKVQEQVYHVLEGEGIMELDGVAQVVRKHDVIFMAPGTVHTLQNTGSEPLVFIVATAPISDD